MAPSSSRVHLPHVVAIAGCLASACGFVCYLVFDISSPKAQGGGSRAAAKPGVPGHETARSTDPIGRQPGSFVPNLGQWSHDAKFVHRSGPMTVFLQERGWVLDVVQGGAERRAPTPAPTEIEPEAPPRDVRGSALRMTFEGDPHAPCILGEQVMPGHHNYFLGADESRWRTGVPRYASIRYENLYPDIDLRMREARGVPEYDLLLRPGADLSRVIVRVEGAKGMTLDPDGSLVIETGLGPITQTAPKTWQVDRAGAKRPVRCDVTLLGTDRFGFRAPDWEDDTSLTIDPGLVWSTFFGGSYYDVGSALAVDDNAIVTLGGWSGSTDLPVTLGTYDATYDGSWDAFVSRLDTTRTGAAQLLYTTYLGGYGQELVNALSIDASGVVTVVGSTDSRNFPTTSGAYDTVHTGQSDCFVSRLDPSQSGAAQLVYSTFFGGEKYDYPNRMFIDGNGVLTLAGSTASLQFPTTTGAYDSTQNGRYDVFVSQLVLLNIGSAALVYSTIIGGASMDGASALFVGQNGIITVGGGTGSSSFPTTSSAYSRTFVGPDDIFVSRLDPRQTGAAQLVYSTFLGGGGASGVTVDANGVVSLVGSATSSFPTTLGAYDTSHNGTWDGFFCRLDPSLNGTAQLLYSTVLGGLGTDGIADFAVDARGIVTVAGGTGSPNFPTTPGAYDRTFSPQTPYPTDAFVAKLNPHRTGRKALLYSTYLGGVGRDYARALVVDPMGVATVAGSTDSRDFPWTSGAYDTVYKPPSDGFVSRLSVGVAFYADRYELARSRAGVQKFALDAGVAHANQPYAIFGSITGTSPGITIGWIPIPLNIDPYTDLTIGSATPPTFVGFRGILDRNGEATAALHVPALPPGSGFTLHHAFLVFDAGGKIEMASPAVPLTIR